MNYRHFIWILPFLSLFSVAQAMELEEECIHEPVFNGQVCVYQANREAEQTILLVHGIGDNASRDWSEQLEPLAQHYHIVTFDLPGFGRSSHGDNIYSPQNYVSVIKFIAEHYALSHFDLLGHSMGAAVALLYAAEYPQSVRRLVVADVAGILHHLAIGKYVIAGKLNDDGDSLSRTESYVVKIIEKFERFFPAAVDDVGKKGEAERAAVELVSYDYSSVLKRVAAPTLILWGTEDRVAPLRTAIVLQHRIKDARLQWIDGAGHMSMREQSARFNEHLLQFLLPEKLEKREHSPFTKKEQPIANDSCERKEEKHFSGYYKVLQVKNCSGVVIRNSYIEKLVVFESRVVIENSHIGGDAELAMDVIGSDIKMTASEVRGKVAMRVARSRLDLAAVDLKGEKTVIESESKTRMIFSVSTVEDEKGRRSIHDVVNLAAQKTL